MIIGQKFHNTMDIIIEKDDPELFIRVCRKRIIEFDNANIFEMLVNSGVFVVDNNCILEAIKHGAVNIVRYINDVIIRIQPNEEIVKYATNCNGFEMLEYIKRLDPKNHD